MAYNLISSQMYCLTDNNAQLNIIDVLRVSGLPLL